MERLSTLTTAMERQAARRMFARTAIAMVRGGTSQPSQRQFAFDEVRSGAWSDTPDVYKTIGAARNAGVRMSAVGAIDGDFSDPHRALWSDASTVFLEDVRAASVVGRITAARRISFNRTAVENVSATGASWVQEGRAIPLRRSLYASIPPMPEKKVASLVVVGNGIATTPVAERNLRTEILRACVEQLDRTFCGDGAGSASEPGGILADAIGIASTGSTVAAITTDIMVMVDTHVANGGQPRGSLWICPVPLWARYTTLKIADAAGTLAGLPVILSAAATKLSLLAAEQLLIAESDLVLLMTSTSGMVEMDDTPTGVTTTPAAATATPVGLFQSDSTALRASLSINWTIAGPTISDGRPAVICLEP